MNVERLAAFSDGEVGGNPAGVVIAEVLPDAVAMQRTAAEIGCSETAFAAPEQGRWRVRYFAPGMEVPFCGHATIALGAVLGRRFGAGEFALRLNAADIRVEAWQASGAWHAALHAPPTRSDAGDAATIHAVLALFGIEETQLDPRIPPARIHAGADHFLLALRSRDDLAAMHYDFDLGRRLMRQHGWITIMLVHVEDAGHFNSRNAFAAGGVYEDPATGAASAAFAGYLRELGWPHGDMIEIAQGFDMGVPSRLRCDIDPRAGSPIRVSGRTRLIEVRSGC